MLRLTVNRILTSTSGHELLRLLHGDSTQAGIDQPVIDQPVIDQQETDLVVDDASEALLLAEATTDPHPHPADASTPHARMIAVSAMIDDGTETVMIEDDREVLSIVTVNETVTIDEETIETEETTVRTVKNDLMVTIEKVCSTSSTIQKCKEYESDTRISERIPSPSS